MALHDGNELRIHYIALFMWALTRVQNFNLNELNRYCNVGKYVYIGIGVN